MVNVRQMGATPLFVGFPQYGKPGWSEGKGKPQHQEWAAGKDKNKNKIAQTVGTEVATRYFIKY
jgi:hypothetical protein